SLSVHWPRDLEVALLSYLVLQAACASSDLKSLTGVSDLWDSLEKPPEASHVDRAGRKQMPVR
ncbi:MAG: hypothetical protein M1133_09265, partial [Armatimonadetes bacterium]|nr:hypothetical protein [Armatimonadota bacterium]